MSKPNVVLIFGESQNDRAALKELTEALLESPPAIATRREPLVLLKGRRPAETKHAAEKIAKVVRADQVRANVIAVIAHEDCDEIEPKHVDVSNTIEDNLRRAGVPQPIAAAPAVEMEAWWYQWPEAVAAVCARWNRLDPKGRSVGLIVDSKKQLQRDLRPRTKGATAPEYEERHSIEIARQVKAMSCVDSRSAQSASFDMFAEKVRKYIV